MISVLLILSALVFKAMGYTRMAAVCEGCDYKGSSEKYVGTKTLFVCLSLCEEDASCKAVDYGRGSRVKECYLNYGGKGSEQPQSSAGFGEHGNFVSYVKIVSDQENGNLYKSMINCYNRPCSSIAAFNSANLLSQTCVNNPRYVYRCQETVQGRAVESVYRAFESNFVRVGAAAAFFVAVVGLVVVKNRKRGVVGDREEEVPIMVA